MVRECSDPTGDNAGRTVFQTATWT